MDHANALVHSVEELLAVCSRSIVAPSMIILEANRILAILNNQNLERKFIVEGCEKLSLLAAGFIRSGLSLYCGLCPQIRDRSHSIRFFRQE